MYLECGNTEQIVDDLREHRRQQAEAWRVAGETSEAWQQWVSHHGGRWLERLGLAIARLGQQLATRAASLETRPG
jgi:hypothetical protein